MERQAMKKLLDWKKSINRKPLILNGARQTGKTHLLDKFGWKHFAQYNENHYHYVNFEENPKLSEIFDADLDPKRIIQELNFFLNKTINVENDLLIFDEIQAVPKAITSLKYFNEKIPELAICCAGSLLGLSLNKSSFPVGKVEFLEIHPMSFHEFLDALQEKQLFELLQNHDITEPFPVFAHYKMLERWKQYLVIGGMPEVVANYVNRINNTSMIELMTDARKLQKNLNTAYMADIAKHSEKADAMHIERVWESVPSQLARVVDGSQKRFMFKDVIEGIKGYRQLESPIGWLEKTNLVKRVSLLNSIHHHPLKAYVKDNMFKLYSFDVGVLGIMSGLEPATVMQFDFGTYKGFFVENAILQELVYADTPQMFCWQGEKSEIEFVFEFDNKVYPIEVKASGNTQAKSLKVFIEKYSPELSFVVSTENKGLKDKIWHVPVYASSRIFDSLKKYLDR